LTKHSFNATDLTRSVFFLLFLLIPVYSTLFYSIVKVKTKPNRPKTAEMNNTAFIRLHTIWLQRIESLHQATTKKRAKLECAPLCTARCCPQARALKDPDYAVGHVAIMLPFEMEYILSKTDIAQEQLQRASLELAPGISIDIGFVTSATPCPFLTDNYQCGIHDIRPLDCRSFPLIPVFNSDETVSFRVDRDCPSAHTFSTSYQDLLKDIWLDLLPELPMNYRILYNQL